VRLCPAGRLEVFFPVGSVGDGPIAWPVEQTAKLPTL
jgi:hypothetical protein